MSEPVLFTPPEGWVGDVIPVTRGEELWLYFLRDVRTDPKPGTAWDLVRTRDLVKFAYDGVGLPHGDDDADDFNAYTGCVVRTGDVDHLFYTGQNPGHTTEDGTTPLQLVMHATSTDGMQTWTKHPEHTFGAPTDRYEPGDWRDPFVFEIEPGQWRMLLAARHTSGPARRRGVIAQCASDDLVTWEPIEPFWDPRRYVTHECPEVFEWNGWWYLVYSEFSESFTTRYRVSRSPHGPWRAPAVDTLDGRAYYAAKSADLNGRRVFIGWIPTKEGDTDDGAWQWAGTMSILEAVQHRDGALGFRMPRELVDSFDTPRPLAFHAPATRQPAAARPGPGVGPGTTTPGSLTAPDGYAAVVSTEPAPERFLLAVDVDIAPGTTECGVLLRASADGDESYVLRLEPRRRRMVLDRWPRRRTGAGQWEISGDVPFAIELERPCDLAPGRHHLDVLVDGTALVATLDGTTTLSARMYDRADGHVGVFVGEGVADFCSVTLSLRGTP